jgi:DNA-binding SARP family transcriptional activator
VLAHLADAAFCAGNYQRCIQFSQRLLEKDNCREDTYRTLMICHAQLGQFGRVRRWYELCVRTLRTVLDIEPSPETEDVYRQSQQTGTPSGRLGVRPTSRVSAEVAVRRTPI